MITDTDHFWAAPTGDLYLYTGQVLGVMIVKGSELRGGDIVEVTGDIWRKFRRGSQDDQPVTMGGHHLTPIAYRAANDHYFAICRPVLSP